MTLTDALLVAVAIACLVDTWHTRKWLRASKQVLKELQAQTVIKVRLPEPATTEEIITTERTYQIGPHDEWFKCLLCGMTSHHPEDVKHRYCGKCHCFHAPGGRLDYERPSTGTATPRSPA